MKNISLSQLSKKSMCSILFMGSIFSSTILTLIPTDVQAQVIYKRINDKGITVYSDYIPTNSKEQYETYSSKTLSLKKVTERELSQEEYQVIDNKKREEENLRKMVQTEKRKDEVLLSTYNSLTDIQRMKDFELGQLNNSIKNEVEILARIKDQNSSLLEQMATMQEGASKNSLQTSMERNFKDIQSLEASISRSRNLYIEKEKKFKEDEERFKRILQEKADAAKEQLEASNSSNSSMSSN